MEEIAAIDKREPNQRWTVIFRFYLNAHWVVIVEPTK